MELVLASLDCYPIPYCKLGGIQFSYGRTIYINIIYYIGRFLSKLFYYTLEFLSPL